MSKITLNSQVTPGKVENPLFDQLFVSIWPKANGIKNGTKRDKVISLSQFLTDLHQKGEELAKEILTRYAKEGKSKTFTDWRALHIPVFVPGKYEFKGTLIDPSPIIIGDLDHIPANQHIQILERLVALPYILAAFPSVTRTGIRFIAWVTNYQAKRHREIYIAVTSDVSQRLNIPLKSKVGEEGPHVDIVSTKGLDQVWYFAHVPRELIYINEKPVALSVELEVREEPEKERKTTGGGKYKTEHTTRDQVLNLVEQIEARRLDLTRGKTDAWFRIGLALFDEFEAVEGLELFHRVSRFHPKYTQEETAQQWEEVRKKENGSVRINTFFEICQTAGILVDHSAIAAGKQKNLSDFFVDSSSSSSDLTAHSAGKRADNRAQRPAPGPKEVQSMEEPVENQVEEPDIEFYEIEKGEPKINYLKLVIFLKALGYRRLDRDGDFAIVHVRDNVIRECSEQDVIDATESFIQNYPEENLPGNIDKRKLLNKLYGALPTYFSKSILGRLRHENPIVLNEHTRDKAFFYFRNGFVEVSKEEIQLKPYSDLKNFIWENQIIDREFKMVDFNEFAFYHFVKNISNAWEKHPYYGRENKHPDFARFESFQTIIGYLLHAFFETNLKAAILTDSRMDDDMAAEPNGRSGKSLLGKSLGYFLNRNFQGSTTYVEIAGKNFKPDNQFRYQELGLDTKLFHLNDAKRNFNVEVLFNDITEGISRERKQQGVHTVKTKIFITTNRTIKLKGSSARARFFEAELADYYDDVFKPDTEFGHWFFAQWTSQQWQQFDSFMLHCVHTYLKKGLIEPNQINLSKRKKIEETSVEFCNWMEDMSPLFTDGKRWDKKDLFTTYIDRYPRDTAWMKQRDFTEWLKTYCRYDETFSEITEKDQIRSNGKDYITFRRTTGGGELQEEDNELPF